MRAAARATGVSEGRLRTWERRYGIPKPARSDTGRRLYDDDDLAMIRRMFALTEAGLAAAEAAEAVLAESGAGVLPATPEPAPEPAPEDPRVGALMEAGRALDEPTIERIIDSAVDEYGWPGIFDAVLFPVMRSAGYEWERGDLTLAHEHFISELVRRRIHVEIARTPQRLSGPPVVLACPPVERHELGLLGVWLGLRQLGARTFYLGADVPREALMGVVRQVDARAVVLTAVAASARPDLVIVAREVATARQAPLLFVGGRGALQGEGGAELMGIRLPPSVVEASRLVASELGLTREEPAG